MPSPSEDADAQRYHMARSLLAALDPLPAARKAVAPDLVESVRVLNEIVLQLCERVELLEARDLLHRNAMRTSAING